MDYLELMRERYSVRDFFDKKLSDEDIKKILEAARLSPSAINKQPTVIYVIKSDEAIERLRAATRMAFNAPLAFLVTYDDNIAVINKFDSAGWYNMGTQDACIAATNMMNEAVSLGLGTLWARGYDTNRIKKAFDLKDNIMPICLLLVGYAKGEPSPLHFQRKSIEEISREL